MKYTLLYLTIVLASLSLMLTGCQNEEAQLANVSGKGRIVLSFSDPAAYLDVTTRAEQPLENIEDYDFTLSGETAEGDPVVDQPLAVVNGEAVINAGTYTLNVRGNSALAAAAIAGNGTAYYAGTSVDNAGNTTTFTVSAGQQTSVRVLLKPANAKVTIVLDGTFTTKYSSATLTSGSRVITLSTESNTVAYFPAGPLSYTVNAVARANSFVTEIIPSEKDITLDPGTSNTITLTADPIEGEIIHIADGEHNGEFD